MDHGLGSLAMVLALKVEGALQNLDSGLDWTMDLNEQWFVC